MPYVIERQYRPSAGADDDPSEWASLPDVPGSVGEIEFDDLEVGAAYDIRWRSRNPLGPASEWVTYLEQIPTGAEQVPPAPTNLRLVGGDCIAWDLPVARDTLEGLLWRHAPNERVAWEAAEPANLEPSTDMPFTLCNVPAGRRVYMARAVDRGGQESATASLIVERAPLDDALAHTIEVRSLAAEGWVGTRQGASLGAGLEADEVDPADRVAWISDLEPAWSIALDVPPKVADDADDDVIAWGRIEGSGAPAWTGNPGGDPNPTQYHWIEYVFTHAVRHCDSGPGTALTLDVSLTARNWRLMYRLLDGNLPAWTGNQYAPAWSGTEPWALGNNPQRFVPWPGRIGAPSPGIYEFRLLVAGGWEQGIVHDVTVRTSATERRETAVLDVPIGGTRLPLTSAMRRVADVLVAPAGGSSARIVVRDFDARNGPWVEAVDEDGASVAGRLVGTVVGF